MTTEDPDPDSEREEDSAAYARAVGACLRRVRQQLRLSLQAVETMSTQEFKASVLGAYERGERAISVPRLQRLALLYDVPVDLLLPAPDRKPVEGSEPVGRGGGRSELDARINAVSGPERELLRRFVRMIQAQRRDGTGSPSIRSEDLRAIELLLGAPARGEDQKDR
jgi:transcriptional regulator with XRE-family HTH domain